MENLQEMKAYIEWDTDIDKASIEFCIPFVKK